MTAFTSPACVDSPHPRREEEVEVKEVRVSPTPLLPLAFQWRTDTHRETRTQSPPFIEFKTVKRKDEIFFIKMTEGFWGGNTGFTHEMHMFCVIVYLTVHV